MIEDEDDPLEKEKKEVAKKVLKNLGGIGLIIFSITIFYGLLDFGETLNLWLAPFLCCIGSFLIQDIERKEDPVRQTLTIVRCNNCDITLVRDYEEGDYVYKQREGDICKECGEKMKIEKIYSVKLKKETVPSEKSSLSILSSDREAK
jgi:hypothetical protein